MSEITQAYLRELLDYDQSSGLFSWKVKRIGVKAGRPAGCVCKHRGVVVVGIDGRLYLAHRLAWMWMVGEWPEVIDHIDGNPANNRFANLRSVSQAVNMQNRRRPAKHNKLGVLGVREANGRFKAELKHQGKRFYVGRFDRKEAAHAAYIEAKRALHPGCTI